MRYHSPQELYALSFRRRDDTVAMLRKLPSTGRDAVNGGTYTTPVPEGRFVAVASRIGLRADNTELLFRELRAVRP